MKKKISIPLIICALAFLVAIVLAFAFFETNYHVKKSEETKQALASLTETAYDGLFLMNFGSEKFDTEDFTVYRAESMCSTGTDFRNLRELGYFLEEAFAVNPDLVNVYLAVDPYKIDKNFFFVAALYQREYMKNLTAYLDKYPETLFEILLPTYDMETLKKFSDRELEDFLTCIQDFVNVVTPYSNAKIHYMGDQLFFNSNPGIYDADGYLKTAQLEVTLLFAFRDDRFMLTAENTPERLETLRKQVAERKTLVREDMSSKTIVFFGDSVMANSVNTFTVPGVLSNLSKATCYNLAMGGSTATTTAEIVNTECTLQKVVEAYLKKDAELLASEKELQNRVLKALEDDAAPDCFVLSFGLNDYFNGLAVTGDNPEDVYTYKGSIATAIRKLKEGYPEAEILVMSPTLCACFEFGEEVVGGHVLEDYVEAAKEVAQEQGVSYLDNYHLVTMTPENYRDYIPDQVHPGELFKFMLAEHISKKLETMILK